MRMITGPATVTPPSRTQLPYGLFSVLSPSTNSQRWEGGGAQWEAMTCEPVSGTPLGLEYAELASELEGALHSADDTGNTIAEAKPFAVHGYFKGSPVGHAPEAAQVRAEEHLLAREQTRVEQALWSGDLSNLPNLAGEGYGDQGESFAHSAPTELGTFSALEAVAELEEFIATMYGSLGVLHMPRRLFTLLTDAVDFTQQGGRLFTPLGTPVVAGGGYGSDGNVNRIYASPGLFGFRSDVDAYVDATAGFSMAQNTMKAIASRSYLLGYDPCGVAYAEVTLGGNGNGGGSVEFPSNMDVTITGSNATLPVNVENDTVPVTVEGTADVSVSDMPDVTVAGTSDVNVTNEPLSVDQVETGGDDG